MTTRKDTPPLAPPHPAARAGVSPLLSIGGILVALVAPGALIGAVYTWSRWRRRRPAPASRWRVAGACAFAALVLQPLVPWTSLVSGLAALVQVRVPGLLGICVQALLGPLLLQLALARGGAPRAMRSPRGLRLHPADAPAPASGPGSPTGAAPSDAATAAERPVPDRTPQEEPAVAERPVAAPATRIPLGRDALGVPYDLTAPDLGLHVFVPGVAGSGKSTTLRRISMGAVAAGFGVAIIDLKGSGLRPTADLLAGRHGLPLSVFDLADPSSLAYNPCTGDPASVANKLIGAFTYAGMAEVYKHSVMHALPIVVAALQAAGRPVTLQTIIGGFEGLGELGRAAGEPHGQEVLILARNATKEKLVASAYVGLRERLGALTSGAFGRLLQAESALDWDAVVAQQSVAYVALSALASSEDVELLGRVLIQDLKQVAERRLQALRRGGTLTPFLIIIDEFAALREPDQIVDLFLQAREAQMGIVVATQFIPENTAVRKALLGAGLIVAHRVEGEDAEALAAQFGTHKEVHLMPSIDLLTGTATRGSAREQHTYNVTPDQLRELDTGVAAVRSLARPLAQRHRVVTIHKGDD